MAKATTPTGRARARRREINRTAPGLLKHLGAAKIGGRSNPVYRPALAAELAELAPPRWASPAPPAKAQAAGVYFDVAEVDRFLRHCLNLRHIKGRRHAGRPLRLDLWQIVYVVGPLLGWRNADGTRLYRTLYLEVPRKNGKSTLCAALALYLLAADREPGAEVVSAARDKDQGRAVFDVAAFMALASPALRRRLNVQRRGGTITREATNSSYRVLSADKAGASKHGLNLHGAVVDELHVITDADYIGTLETATGSRDQPLVAFITTAGIPGESPVWEDKRAAAEKVAERVVEDPTLLVAIWAGPDDAELTGSWSDPAVWKASNPGYGTSLRPEYLEAEAAKAKASPSRLNRFLRLHLDVPTDSVTGFVPVPTWDRTASMVDEGDLEGRRAFGGLDLAATVDFASLALVFPDDDDELLDVVMRFWTPADTLTQRAHRDGADYERWAREGKIIATPGEVIDYDLLEGEVTTLAAPGRGRFDVAAINYDPFGSPQLREHLTAAGIELHEMRQGFLSMSAPMRELERLVVAKKLRHGGHPMLRHNIAGLKVAQDPAGNIKPDRKHSTARIDGAVALTMAIDAWLRSLATTRPSVYEERGVVVA